MGRGQELRRQSRADRPVGPGVALDREDPAIAPDLDRIFLTVVVGLCRECLERVAAPDFLRAVMS